MTGKNSQRPLTPIPHDRQIWWKATKADLASFAPRRRACHRGCRCDKQSCVVFGGATQGSCVEAPLGPLSPTHATNDAQPKLRAAVGARPGIRGGACIDPPGPTRGLGGEPKAGPHSCDACCAAQAGGRRWRTTGDRGCSLYRPPGPPRGLGEGTKGGAPLMRRMLRSPSRGPLVWCMLWEPCVPLCGYGWSRQPQAGPHLAVLDLRRGLGHARGTPNPVARQWESSQRRLARRATHRDEATHDELCKKEQVK